MKKDCQIGGEFTQTRNCQAPTFLDQSEASLAQLAGQSRNGTKKRAEGGGEDVFDGVCSEASCVRGSCLPFDAFSQPG